MGRIIVACLLAFIAACAPHVSVVRGSQPFSEPATGLRFVSEICGLPKRQLSIYPGRGSRLSVHYENNDLIKATFYIHDAGRNNVDDGPVSEAVETYFRQTITEIREMHRQGRYGKAELGELTRVPIRLGVQRLDALCTFCELSTGALDLGSYVLVTGYRGRLVKVRYTYPKELEESAREKWECILLALGDTGS